jgi:hypothetical protein
LPGHRPAFIGGFVVSGVRSPIGAIRPTQGFGLFAIRVNEAVALSRYLSIRVLARESYVACFRPTIASLGEDTAIPKAVRFLFVNQ